MSFWVSSLRPLRFPVRILGNADHMWKVETLIGDLPAWKILKSYRSLQILNRLQTSCLASPRIASHQSFLQIVTVLSAFCSIRYFDQIHNNVGYIMMYIGIAISLFMEFIETRIISYVIQVSKNLIYKMEQLVRREWSFEGKLLLKEVRASWSLRVDVAYPYYEMRSRTFWEFVDIALRFLVDALLAY